MSDLRARAEAFLRRPYPAGDRAPLKETDGLLQHYLAGAVWDDELLELLSLCLLTARMEAGKHTGELKDFHAEAVAVLVSLQNEASASIE